MKKYVAGRTMTDKMGGLKSMGKVKLRFYILEEESIRRAGLDSQGKRKFAGLVCKNALLVSMAFTESNVPVIFKIDVTVINFDEEGKWFLDPIEIQKAAIKHETLFEDKSEAPSNLVRFLPQPKLSSKQRELLKARVIKELGVATWNIAVLNKLV